MRDSRWELVTRGRSSSSRSSSNTTAGDGTTNTRFSGFSHDGGGRLLARGLGADWA